MSAPLKRHARRLLPRRVSTHRIWAGPLRGRSLVTSWHDYPGAILGYTERALLRWFADHVRPQETWLDVGAHYGYTALALSELVGPKGRVFAFEPAIPTAGLLSRTRALNDLQQLTVVPLGLSATAALQPIEVPLVRGMAEHSAELGAGGLDRIFAVGFDEIWPGLSCGNQIVHGVKIDVQGMELEVLKGMRQMLSFYRPRLVLELHPGVDREALRRLLTAVGYHGAGEAIEPSMEGVPSELLDNRSYSFASTHDGRSASLAKASEGGLDDLA